MTRALTAVVCLVAGLALTGCDGGDDPASAPVAGAPATSTGAGLDACRTVSAALLHDDLGLAVTGAGETSPSFYGDAGVTDCAWFDGHVSVSVHATDDAARDLPDGVVQGFLQSGGEAVPGADRGVALATSDVDGSNVDLIVVHGRQGLEMAAATDAVVSPAQAVRLGQDVLAALG